MVRVKICGITNLEDALAAVEAGADALGFVFYKKSPRYINPEKAKAIIGKLPKRIIRVGVFVNAKEAFIRKVAKTCGLNLLQFHADESPEFCRRFGNWRVVKAFRVKGALCRDEILKYKTYAYLFDTYKSSVAGGTGKSFNWKLLPNLDKIKRPVFLSGGIGLGNVKQAIKAVHPDWIDASSSLESSPGKKDHRKLQKFIEAVRKIAL